MRVKVQIRLWRRKPVSLKVEDFHKSSSNWTSFSKIFAPIMEKSMYFMISRLRNWPTFSSSAQGKSAFLNDKVLNLNPFNIEHIQFPDVKLWHWLCTVSRVHQHGQRETMSGHSMHGTFSFHHQNFKETWIENSFQVI